METKKDEEKLASGLSSGIPEKVGPVSNYKNVGDLKLKAKRIKAKNKILGIDMSWKREGGRGTTSSGMQSTRKGMDSLAKDNLRDEALTPSADGYLEKTVGPNDSMIIEGAGDKEKVLIKNTDEEAMKAALPEAGSGGGLHSIGAFSGAVTNTMAEQTGQIPTVGQSAPGPDGRSVGGVSAESGSSEMDGWSGGEMGDENSGLFLDFQPMNLEKIKDQGEREKVKQVWEWWMDREMKDEDLELGVYKTDRGQVRIMVAKDGEEREVVDVSAWAFLRPLKIGGVEGGGEKQKFFLDGDEGITAKASTKEWYGVLGRLSAGGVDRVGVFTLDKTEKPDEAIEQMRLEAAEQEGKRDRQRLEGMVSVRFDGDKIKSKSGRRAVESLKSLWWTGSDLEVAGKRMRDVSKIGIWRGNFGVEIPGWMLARAIGVVEGTVQEIVGDKKRLIELMKKLDVAGHRRFGHKKEERRGRVIFVDSIKKMISNEMSKFVVAWQDPEIESEQMKGRVFESEGAGLKLEMDFGEKRGKVSIPVNEIEKFVGKRRDFRWSNWGKHLFDQLSIDGIRRKGVEVVVEGKKRASKKERVGKTVKAKEVKEPGIEGGLNYKSNLGAIDRKSGDWGRFEQIMNSWEDKPLRVEIKRGGSKGKDMLRFSLKDNKGKAKAVWMPMSLFLQAALGGKKVKALETTDTGGWGEYLIFGEFNVDGSTTAAELKKRFSNFGLDGVKRKMDWKLG